MNAAAHVLASPLATFSSQIAPASRKARSNKAKREKWKEKLKLWHVDAPKKREGSAARLAERLAHTQNTTAAQFSVTSLPKTKSALAGSLSKASKEYTARLHDDQDHFCQVLTSLHPVPYKYSPPLTMVSWEVLHHFCSYVQRGVANFRDCNGICFGLHAFRNHRMDSCFMERLVRRIDRFVMACGIQQPANQHARGSFAQAIIGYNHGMGEGHNVSKLIPPCISRSHDFF
jgi:hypothetical protein